jgi:hypothetical protein
LLLASVNECNIAYAKLGEGFATIDLTREPVVPYAGSVLLQQSLFYLHVDGFINWLFKDSSSTYRYFLAYYLMLTIPETSNLDVVGALLCNAYRNDLTLGRKNVNQFRLSQMLLKEI